LRGGEVRKGVENWSPQGERAPPRKETHLGARETPIAGSKGGGGKGGSINVRTRLRELKERVIWAVGY